MPYNIDETLTVGDAGHVEHHEALATAVNDIDLRVTANVSKIIVLGAAEAIPVGTAANTVIIRKGA